MSEQINMKFRAHDTFFIRKGWLSKGLRNVVRDPDVFKGTNDNPMDVLGIGANMVMVYSECTSAHNSGK